MKKDPIIEEVRAIRRQLSEEAGNDLQEICRRLREWEEAHPERMVAATIAPVRTPRNDAGRSAPRSTFDVKP